MLVSTFSSSSPSPSPSCFSFSVRSPLATFLRSLPPIRECEQEVYASPVQSVSAWRKQAKAEASAGIEPQGSQVLVSLFECHVCGVHVGPGYVHQELFLYPVRNTTIIRDRPMHYKEALLYACGECARHRRRLLPEWLRIVEPTCWETTRLLTAEGEEARPTQRTQLVEMKQIYTAIRQMVQAFTTLLFTLSLISLGFSLSLFKPTVTMKKEVMAQQTHTLSSPKGQLLSFNRSLNSNTLSQFLRTPAPHQTERNAVFA